MDAILFQGSILPTRQRKDYPNHRFRIRTGLATTVASRIKNKDRYAPCAFYFALGLVVVLALSSAASGVNGFDEQIQFVGLTSVLEHARDVLQLKNPDFTAIHSNLEFYGIAPRLPAFFLWNITKFIRKVLDPFGDLGLSTYSGSDLRDAYKSGYFALSHIVSVSYLIGTSLIVNRVTRNLGASRPEFAGAMTLLFPALLGFSLISVKDTAVAFFYSLYSYALASVWQQRVLASESKGHNGASRLAWFHGCMAGMLISTYASSLFVVLLSEAIMALFFSRTCRVSIQKLFRQGLTFVVFAALSWFVLSPQAWTNPLRFLVQSIHYSLDGTQAWGGCMNFLNTCPRKGESWNILVYFREWLFSSMPLLHLFGLTLAGCWLVVGSKNLVPKAISHSKPSHDFGKRKRLNPFLLAFILQASVIPGALILSNGFIYDGTRHVLFLLPALTMFSYLGLEQTFELCRKGAQRLLLALATLTMTALLLIDLFLLHPFQYTYFNELALARGVNWTNTDVDFYYASDAESLRNFMKTEQFQQFASEGGLDIKGSPPMDHAYNVEHFPRKRGHKYFFTNHTREPGVSLRKDCKQAGKSVYRKQLLGPINIYGTPQVCLSSSYRDWDPF